MPAALHGSQQDYSGPEFLLTADEVVE